MSDEEILNRQKIIEYLKENVGDCAFSRIHSNVIYFNDASKVIIEKIKYIPDGYSVKCHPEIDKYNYGSYKINLSIDEVKKLKMLDKLKYIENL